jgi:hypothetical protein
MEKSEWEYLSATLIFGPHRIRSKDLSVFSLDVFRSRSDLSVSQVSSIDTETRRLDTKRHLKLRTNIGLTATHIQASSEIAKIIIFENTEKKVHLSDAIFTDREFELTGFVWERLIESRISKLAMLIKAIVDMKLDDVPLLINGFPNISGLFLKDMNYWS